MVKRLILMFLLATAVLFSGCLLRPKTQITTSTPTKPTQSQAEKETDPLSETADLFTDENGMVTVRISNGEIGLAFNPKKWPDRPEKLGWKIITTPEGNQQTRFFPVKGFSGTVKAVCIGQMPGFAASYAEAWGIAVPIAVFLMEDGSLEWLWADPSWYMGGPSEGEDEAIHSMGKIPWLENIVSLSYESTRDGSSEEKSIFAQDSAGVRYDLKHPCNFQSVFYGVWRCNLRTEDNYSAYLYFENHDEVKLEKGWLGTKTEIYVGKYQLYLAEDGLQGARAGNIGFDLTLDWSIQEGEGLMDVPRTIRGTYLVEFEWRGVRPGFDFYLSSGDNLHTEEGVGWPPVYRFRLGDMPGGFDYGVMGDQELMEYLLSSVPKAGELVYERGMIVLIPGDTTELADGSVCRNIWLGTDTGDSYVWEIFYTIDRWGTIYQYDPVLDTWKVVS
ncbi:MAG: hypothetical protein GX276_00380 [Clostridiaceae bacterium]|nr:hypothetical protein [Clostridiaceae bacterium]